MSGIRIAGREFRPGWVPSLAAAAFIALTVALGDWQTRRAEEKVAAGRRIDEAARGPVLALPSSRVDAAVLESRRVSVRGTFDARGTLFLDNKILHGIPGYQILTPIRPENGGMPVLVNRGWVAAGDRSSLPVVPTPVGVQTIEGEAVVPSARFLELAPEQAAGPLRENLVLAREEKRLGLTLQPVVIQQTSDTSDGLAREWERPDTGVDRHRSYALQWYSFAALAAVLYVLLGFKRAGDATGR